MADSNTTSKVSLNTQILHLHNLNQLRIKTYNADVDGISVYAIVLNKVGAEKLCDYWPIFYGVKIFD